MLAIIPKDCLHAYCVSFVRNSKQQNLMTYKEIYAKIQIRTELVSQKSFFHITFGFACWNSETEYSVCVFI